MGNKLHIKLGDWCETYDIGEVESPHKSEATDCPKCHLKGFLVGEWELEIKPYD